MDVTIVSTLVGRIIMFSIVYKLFSSVHCDWVLVWLLYM